MIYLDSSVLLELYLHGARWEEARRILGGAEAKASSHLLVVEVSVCLRRKLDGAPDRDALHRSLARFDADVAGINFVDSLPDVGRRIRSDERFSRCRSLAAVHACTALLLKEWTGEPVRLATFDRRLRALAAELGLA